MDMILVVKALILGIVEGITEFLPISSTGHLILVGDLLHFNDETGKVFEIVIQLGAILAVCWVYRDKLIDVILTSEKRTKDKGYRARLEKYPTPRLYDLQQAAAKRAS